MLCFAILRSSSHPPPPAFIDSLRIFACLLSKVSWIPDKVEQIFRPRYLPNPWILSHPPPPVISYPPSYNWTPPLSLSSSSPLLRQALLSLSYDEEVRAVYLLLLPLIFICRCCPGSHSTPHHHIIVSIVSFLLLPDSCSVEWIPRRSLSYWWRWSTATTTVMTMTTVPLPTEYKTMNSWTLLHQ